MGLQGNRRLQVARAYGGFQGDYRRVTRTLRGTGTTMGFQRVKEGYKRLQGIKGITGGYRGLHGVTWGYRGLQGGSRGTGE